MFGARGGGATAAAGPACIPLHAPPVRSLGWLSGVRGRDRATPRAQVRRQLAPLLPRGGLWPQDPALLHATLFHASPHAVRARPHPRRGAAAGSSPALSGSGAGAVAAPLGLCRVAPKTPLGMASCGLCSRTVHRHGSKLSAPSRCRLPVHPRGPLRAWRRADASGNAARAAPRARDGHAGRAGGGGRARCSRAAVPARGCARARRADAVRQPPRLLAGRRRRRPGRPAPARPCP